MSERVDLVTSEPHFLAHTLPVWRALPPQYRGIVYAPASELDDLHDQKIPARETPERRLPTPGDNFVICSAYGDLARFRQRRRDVVFMEHGAGQTYSVNRTSFAGGPHRENVCLFLCPNERVAAVNRKAWPHAPSVVVGCPKLDPWHSGEKRRRRARRPVAALSFHWESRVVPETRSTLRHYRDVLRDLARDDRFEVLGHAHPRLIFNPALRQAYDRAGIEIVETFDEVLDRADVYAVDNSSTLYEFASTGRPVVVMNAPWYRRNVRHGLRFWEFADVGLQVDQPAELADTIHQALKDPDEVRERREAIVEQVYPVRDGTAAERAAEAIVSIVNGPRCPACGAAHSTCARQPGRVTVRKVRSATKGKTYRYRGPRSGQMFRLTPESAARRGLGDGACVDLEELRADRLGEEARDPRRRRPGRPTSVYEEDDEETPESEPKSVPTPPDHKKRSPEQTPSKAEELVAGSVPELVDELDDVDDPDLIRDALEVEAAHRDRKTAREALEARLEELDELDPVEV